MNHMLSRTHTATILATLIALIASLAVLISASPVDAFPGANGMIAYTQSGAIRAVNPNGSGDTLIHAQGMDPAWSADGQSIAFTDTSTGDFNIWIANADGSGATQVSTGLDDFDPTWSPDGEWLAFRRVEGLTFAAGAATATDATGITLTDTTAGAFDDVQVGDTVTNTTTTNIDTVTAVGATTLTMTGIAGGWTAGDGYTVTEDYQRLFKVKNDGTMETKLSSAGAADRYNDYAPDWSPDGTQIAYATSRNGADDVYVMSSDGEGAGAPTNLTGDILDVAWDPSWSPDGTAIAFASADDDDGGSTPENIWRMDADGSAKAILTSVPTAKDEHPSWSPDGTTIVFEREVGADTTLHTVPAAGGSTSLLAAAPPSRTEPHWQPMLAGVPDAYGVDEGATLGPAGTGVLDNDALFAAGVGTATAVKDTDPVNGTLTLNADGTFTYVHDGSETTTDSFTYHPVQGGVSSSPVAVTITITPVNDSPVAGDDGPYNVANGDSVSISAPGVLANDSDAEGAVTADKLSDPANGTVTLNSDGSFTYTHDGSATTTDSFTYRAKDSGGAFSNVATVSFLITDSEVHQTALVDPTQGLWYLFDDAGDPVDSFYFGNPGDYPFMGDWNCDGVETPGMYRQSDGYVYLRNSNTQGVGDIRFFFGNPGDVPIAGDFDDDGCDTVSIYRPSNQTFYIINELGENDGGLGAAEFFYVFGNPGDKPFVGDFDGDGVETVGLHRESTGLVYFRNSHTTGIADAEFIFGDPGDRLIAGDWNGDGSFSPALFRPSNTTMYFRFTNTQGVADAQWVPDGATSTWLPVSGTR